MSAEEPVSRATMDDELARTLGAAAELAPAPEPDFYAAVRDRQRRITRQRTAVTGLSAAVAVLVLSATVLVVRPLGDGPAGEAPAGPVASQVPAATGDPGASPWPVPAARAKERSLAGAEKPPLVLPPLLPDGQRYIPSGTINNVVVVQPLINGDRAAPVLLDTTTGAKVATLGPPGGEGKFRYPPVAWGGSGIGWWTRAREGDPYAELWFAPYDGFVPVMLAEVRDARARITSFAVGGRALWWSTDSGTVYRLPLDGSAGPAEVPSAKGTTVVGGDHAVRTRDLDAGIPGGVEIIDLDTGAARRTPTSFENATESPRCGLWACVANTRGLGAFAQGFDGRSYALGFALEQVTVLSGAVVGKGPDGWVLWDLGDNEWFRLSTGDIKGMWDYTEPTNLSRPYVWWTERDGSHRLWDLTKG
jgi:hypothetical protein